MLDNSMNEFLYQMSSTRDRIPHDVNAKYVPIFPIGINRIITPQGLRLITNQWKLLRNPLFRPSCSGNFERIYGVPCCHTIGRMLNGNAGAKIGPHQIHSHWWFERPNGSPLSLPGLPQQPPPTYLDPNVIRHGQARFRRDNSTRRDASHWEGEPPQSREPIEPAGTSLPDDVPANERIGDIQAAVCFNIILLKRQELTITFQNLQRIANIVEDTVQQGRQQSLRDGMEESRLRVEALLRRLNDTSDDQRAMNPSIVGSGNIRNNNITDHSIVSGPNITIHASIGPILISDSANIQGNTVANNSRIGGSTITFGTPRYHDIDEVTADTVDMTGQTNQGR
jgi:hypothetical protein